MSLRCTVLVFVPLCHAAAGARAAEPPRNGTIRSKDPYLRVKVWVEAESHSKQRGSTERFYSMPGASGGRIVDNSWGGREGPQSWRMRHAG